MKLLPMLAASYAMLVMGVLEPCLAVESNGAQHLVEELAPQERLNVGVLPGMDNKGRLPAVVVKAGALGFLTLLDAVPLDNSGVVMVGERGLIIRFPGEKNRWEQVPCPTDSTLTGVAKGLDGSLWAVGHDGVILKGSKDARTWHVVSTPASDGVTLLDVQFDDEIGIISGGYGTVLRTVDGGQSWEAQTLAKRDWMQPHLFGVARIPTTKGAWLISAEGGSVFRSTDDGLTWEKEQLSYEGSLFGVIVAADGGSYVFGMRGALFHSVANNEWRRVVTNTEQSLFSGVVDTAGVIRIVGGDGVVLKFVAGNDSNIEQIRGFSGTGMGVVLADGDLSAAVWVATTLGPQLVGGDTAR